ncbi:MAG TPA: hypothetical protein VGD77_00875 [Gemmatimonadaceae bacterium]
MMRQLRNAFALVAALVATGCATTTTELSVPSIVGTWSYVGQRTSGPSNVVRYNGRLNVRNQQGMAFDADFAAEALTAQGSVTLVTGLVVGAFASREALDFDVQVGEATLTHVGRLHGDTISGSWIGSDNAQGTFVAVRQRP